jgi:hypothetical protein
MGEIEKKVRQKKKKKKRKKRQKRVVLKIKQRQSDTGNFVNITL